MVLATGGFEWDPELVRSFLRGPMTSQASIPTNVIPGLFAAGNVAAAPTGMVYGGAGGTLGPIITFACRAGTAASRPDDLG